MKEYWYGIKIEDIKSVSNGCGGSYGGGEIHERFDICMKDGSKHEMHYISREGKREGEKARLEIKTLFNEFNKVPEMYTLENDTFARINGESRKFGYRCENNLGQYVHFTNKEIDKLRKEFKIKDEGWRHLMYIEELAIVGNKATRPLEQRDLDQLEYMGYDISKLEYELKQA